MQNTLHEPTTSQSTETVTHSESKESLRDEILFAGASSLIPSRASRTQPTTSISFSLPERGLSSALIAGTIAGVLFALLTILIILINTGTAHAAILQIAMDSLTVKTALVLAALELLTLVLGLLIGFVTGFVVGKIAVLRRLGFLAGMCAGTIYYLIIFLVSLLPGYPGNLITNAAPMTTTRLIIPFLLLCLWSIGGGLIGLFGTWLATVRHPYYLQRERIVRRHVREDKNAGFDYLINEKTDAIKNLSLSESRQ
ncbi:MAG TPA: YrzE family protein [Ktedonobacteraceae bacterium]|nr:YrzE family protein [Ktedonobacteraceae bacterium]